MTASLATRPPSPHPISKQADDDAQLLQLWLHGKSDNTQEAYYRDVREFVEYVDQSLHEVKVRDIQAWMDHLAERGLAISTIARKVASIKSLFTFGQKIGYLQFNVGAAIQTPKVPDDLAERILSRPAVKKILQAVDNERDVVLIRLFYATGGRVSELRQLTWRAVAARDRKQGPPTGQLLLRGKGRKNRNVLLSSTTWSELMRFAKVEADCGYGRPSDPIFRSRKGGFLSRQQMWRIIKHAAVVAGLPKAVSPHWLRHAHASHALDGGAPVHLVKETLGHKSLATTSRYTHARPDDSSSQYLDL